MRPSKARLIARLPGFRSIPERPASIALVTVATGNYGELAEKMGESARKWFFPMVGNRRFFVFGDTDVPGFERIPVPHMAWPNPTLWRWSRIWSARSMLREFDAVFYCDADMRFVDIVQFPVRGMVGTIHPGFYRNPRKPYETRKESKAACRGKTYFAGGFVGGHADGFLSMAKAISDATDDDFRRGVIAKHHDESHLNAYFAKFPPATSLSPAYCYPETWNLPFEKRLLALNKDHKQIRSAAPMVPKIGVVLFHNDMPKYRPEWIDQCVKSIRDQSITFSSYEVIYGGAQANLMGGNQHQIDIRPDITDYATAQNRAMEMAFEDGCDYVLNVNLDDLYDRHYVEKTVSHAMRHGTDITSCDMQYIDADGVQGKRLIMSERLPEVEFPKGNNIIAHPATCWSRRFWEAGLRMDPAKIPAEDFDCWKRALGLDMRFGIVPERLLNYRIHTGQVGAQPKP